MKNGLLLFLTLLSLILSACSETGRPQPVVVYVFRDGADSPQNEIAKPTNEKFVKRVELETRIAKLQREVVEAPDDRMRYWDLLEAGLQDYELVYTQSRFPERVRNDILNLKLVMEDMYSLQYTIAEMEITQGIDGEELINRLKTRKIPPAHRRSVPLMDPWGTPYRLLVYPGNRWGFRYKIVSAGSDKKFDPANLGLSEQEIMKPLPEKRSLELSDDIVFIDGENFTQIFDYPKNAQTFLYTRCEPADEQQPERVRCW
jgi:hypothetical protein